MVSNIFRKAILALGVMTVCALPVVQASAEEFTREQIEGIISQYLQDNPEAILDSLEGYRNREEKKRQVQTQDGIEKNWDKLTAKDAPSIGAADAKITVVEFFDYNCGYCKRALPDIQELVKNNNDVRVVFQEMPILSPGSRDAARWALAAHKQGKYFDYHAALMDHRGPKNADELKKLAEDIGLDIDKLMKDVESDEVKAMMEEHIMLGRKIGVQGTPAFIVQKKFYPGYLGPDGLEDAVKDARENKG